MILLSVKDLSKRYGPEPVLDRVSFDVRAGERVSLVGPNGTGKTTLLRVLAAPEEADTGTVQLSARARVGMLEQQADFAVGSTVWDEARDALGDLIALGHEAERAAEALSSATDEAERSRLGKRFDHLQHMLQLRDGYNLDHKIERVLSGLGFETTAFSQPVLQLSGGQQNRLLLAKLLLQQPDLLLLDEPSNHLDIAATEWLEDYLVSAGQALIVVSHDRYFLDKVTERTLELLRGTVESYAGNYSAYQRQKKERLEVERRTYERQQGEIAKMKDFIRRHHYGQKHAQAEDRRKKLERIELVDLPREITAPVMGFPEATRSGDIVVRVEGLSKSFAEPLFQDVSFDILRGERWGILGPNGSGKTTLVRCLLGQCEPDEGRVVTGAEVRVGYFDQLLRCLDDDEQTVDAIRPDHKEFFEQQRRDLLARFGLTDDMVFQKVSSLSGGERNRAALAMLAASDANFLVLDEPTNHLDLWARESLERSLKAFNGTLLFVSHDRYFLNRVADHLLVIGPERCFVIEGNYETYLYLARQRLAADDGTSSQPNETPVAAGEKKRPQSDKKSARRKRKFPYRKVADIESEIAERENRIDELHAALASPEVARDGNRIKQATAELAQHQQTLGTLYEHWEEATELNG